MYFTIFTDLDRASNFLVNFDPKKRIGSMTTIVSGLPKFQQYFVDKLQQTYHTHVD